MEFIICLLIIIVLMLFLYIFILKREIKRIANRVRNVRNENSNTLINKELEEKNLVNLIREINNTINEINKKEINMNIKTEELKKMITNTAHDLRTPLTSAIGYIELIQNNNIAEGKKEKYIQIISERLQKLSYLITNLFEFSKIISNDNKIEMKEENLIEIIEGCIANFYDDFIKENRQININHENNKIEIITDKSLLTRAFDNMIVNSYKHSKGNLDIEIIEKNGEIIIKFINKLENNKLDIDLIFEKFYTTDISRTNGDTGLGLAIAKEFIELTNGNISAIKEDGLLKMIVNIKKIN